MQKIKLPLHILGLELILQGLKTVLVRKVRDEQSQSALQHLRFIETFV